MQDVLAEGHRRLATVCEHREAVREAGARLSETAVLRVVVADDDSDIRALVAIAMRRAGLEIVAEVASGEAALDAIRELRPDMAVLDVSMPGMTGLEVTRVLKSEAELAGIRVFLLSAGATDAAVAAGLEAGADEYLTKPFSPRVLAAQVREVIASWDAR
jgi:DNA-binding response OmpR family regulator